MSKTMTRTGELIVRGKGDKERTAYIDDGAGEAVEVSGPAVRGRRTWLSVLPGDPNRRCGDPGYDRSGYLRHHPIVDAAKAKGASLFVPRFAPVLVPPTSSTPGLTFPSCSVLSGTPTSPPPPGMTDGASTPTKRAAKSPPHPLRHRHGMRAGTLAGR